MKKFFFLLVISYFPYFSVAQYRPITSSEILLKIKKLNVLGSVLYIAAHPDDENTRLIAYLSKGELVRTGYLSLTRGDGGQNLIGTEFGEAIGILRTQELLEARKLDGGEQFFTRAVDFGYSKSADETLKLWDRKKILADVVWHIRRFQPDVIITRFPADKRAGHGHHTASTILANEAFELANDPKAFPEQLNEVNLWKPTRIFWNTGRFWEKDLDAKLAKKDGSAIALDVGKYNALLGKSYNEIASLARSKHKSQGFGARLWRGEQLEYLVHTGGSKAQETIFEDIDLTWNRVKGGKSIGVQIEAIIADYDIQNPEKAIPALVKLYKALDQIEDTYWRTQKKKEVQEVILDCAGLYVEAVTSDYTAQPGAKITVQTTLVNRSETALTLQKVRVGGKDSTVNQPLMKNQSLSLSNTQRLMDKQISQAYWLEGSYQYLYDIKDRQRMAQPENRPALLVEVTLALNGLTLTESIPVQYKWVDSVVGEQFRPIIITPSASLKLMDEVLVFPSNTPKKVSISVQALQDNFEGNLKLNAPKGWQITPQEVRVAIPNKYQEVQYSFTVHPPQTSSEGQLSAILQKGEKTLSQSLELIEHPHITKQTFLREAKAKVVRFDLKRGIKKVAYIMGAGDKIPESLQQVGYEVTRLAADKLLTTNLSQYEAIMIGIRAYNTEKGLISSNQKLLDYVRAGGTLLVQYNTSFDMLLQDIAPYPIQFGRGRVTEEDSPVKFVDASLPVLQTPNRLSTQDFEGWVQERGLYFAKQWDSKFKPVIAWNDQGEQPLEGGLLVAPYGKGYYIYTGISFFRQLPAGVPGAYRLLANLLAK